MLAPTLTELYWDDDLRAYEAAREHFEQALSCVGVSMTEQDSALEAGALEDLAGWFGDGGVTDYRPMFKALVAADRAGVVEARELLNLWADSYGKDRS